MKKILIFLFVSIICFAQSSNDLLNQAFNSYKDFNYGAALKLFELIKVDSSLDQKTKSFAKFYSADCLLNLDQLDGAAIEFENFIQDNFSSDLKPSAYYKLGTIYNQKREYRKTRDRFFSLIKLFPYSEFHGSALYWIGESFAAENKFADAEDYFKDAIANKRSNSFYPNTLYSLAQVYEKTSDYKKAIEFYDEILTYYRQSSLSPKAQLRIGISYFNSGDYDNAILELSDNQINSLSQSEILESKYFLATAHARLNEFTEAKEILNEILKSSSDSLFNKKVNFTKAWIDFNQAKYLDAFKVFDELYKSSQDSLKALSLYWSGECQRYFGNSKVADEIFKKFLDEFPEHRLAPKAQLGRGAVFVNQNNSSNAELSLQNAILSNDKTTRIKALTILGEIRLNNNMFIEAKKYFSDALALKPNSNDIQNRLHLGLGVANYFLKNYNEAEKNFEELKKNDKNFETDKVNFYLAEVYYAQGKYIAALKNYNLIKSTDKLIAKQSLLGKAYSYFNSKEFSNAINFFEDFINRYPNDKNIDEIKLRLADSYFGAKRFDKAASMYKEIINENKNLNNDLAYYQFAQALFKAGKSEDAKNAFQDLQVKFPKSKYIDESQYVIGWIAFQQNKFDEAINSYKQLSSKYPNSELRPIAEYSIGDSYFNKASYDSAIYYYSKVIDNYPNSQFIFDAVNGIQYAYVAKDQPQNAISFIDDFISSHPSSKFSDQIYFKKGDLFYSLEKFNEAVVAYKDFITKYPKSSLVPNAYYWIGKSYSNLKKFTEAIPNFSSARSISPKSDIGISSTVELVEIYQQKNQLEDALKILEETIASNATSNRIPELLFLQGVVENKSNKTDDAISTFDQIATYYNGSLYSAKAKVELGKIEISRNNFDKAQSYLREVAENRLDDIGAQAQYYYGISFFNQNKIEDAITQFVRTRSVFSAYDEWYTKSLLRLGDCFIKMNDKKQAREMFRAVLIRHTNDSFADEAKKKMKGL